MAAWAVAWRLAILVGVTAVAAPAVFDRWIAAGRPVPGGDRRRALLAVGGFILVAVALGGIAGAAAGAGGERSLGWNLPARPARGPGLAGLVPAGLLGAGALAAAVFWRRNGRMPRRFSLLVIAGGILLTGQVLVDLPLDDTIVIPQALQVLATAVWAGGLWSLASLPWSPVELPTVADLARRFAVLEGVFLLILAGTGGLLAYRNLYAAEALLRTPYGQALSIQGALTAALLVLVAVDRFAIRPRLEGRQPSSLRLRGERMEQAGHVPGPAARAASGSTRPDQAGADRLKPVWRGEAMVAGGLLAVAALLCTLPAAQRPADMTDPRRWEVGTTEQKLQLAVEPALRALEPAGAVGALFCVPRTAGEPGLDGAVRLVAKPLDASPLKAGTVMVDMADHPLGRFPVALQAVDGTLQGEAVFPMPGRWRLRWTLVSADGSTHAYDTEFRATGAPGNPRRVRFAPALALQGLPTALLAAAGLAGAALGAALVVAGYVRLLPGPALTGLAAIAFCGWLLRQVLWIDAYPTTYTPNPLPATAPVLDHGRRVYAQYCATCHGVGGRGDGPAAAALTPPPSDLTGLHARQHLDGDLYWWITHGIPGTAMPAFRDLLSEEDRWAVIRFIRSLPPAGRALAPLEDPVAGISPVEDRPAPGKAGGGPGTRSSRGTQSGRDDGAMPRSSSRAGQILESTAKSS